MNWKELNKDFGALRVASNTAEQEEPYSFDDVRKLKQIQPKTIKERNLVVLSKWFLQKWEGTDETLFWLELEEAHLNSVRHGY